MGACLDSGNGNEGGDPETPDKVAPIKEIDLVEVLCLHNVSFLHCFVPFCRRK